MSGGSWPEDEAEGPLYHYCSERAARDIVEDEPPPYFLVGAGSRHGWGMYATDIEPVDLTSIEQVSSECFAGGASHAELNHVLVLDSFDARRHFKRVAPYEWVLGENVPGEMIDLETLLVEVRRFDGRGWSVIAGWDGTEWT
ncbi:MAG: hypothetical protein ACRDK7_15525 [Solirubrobacteraceae bacterium]